LFVVLFASVALAVVLDEVRYGRRIQPPRYADRKGVRIASAALVAITALVLLLPNIPYPAGAVNTPSFFTSADIKSVPSGSVALLYPFPEVGVDDDFPQLWQASTGMRFKTPGGYFVVPMAVTNRASLGRLSLIGTALFALYFGTELRHLPSVRQILRQELQSWHVQTVIAQPVGRHPELPIEYLTWLLGKKPVFIGGVDVWYKVNYGP
jgi:hypothetical protein